MKLPNLKKALQVLMILVAMPISATAISIPNSEEIFDNEKTEIVDGIKYTKIENGRNDNKSCMEKQMTELKTALRDYETRNTLNAAGIKGVKVKLTSTSLDTDPDQVRKPLARITKDKYLYVNIKPLITPHYGYTGFCFELDSKKLKAYITKVQEFLNKNSEDNSTPSNSSSAQPSQPVQ